MAREEHATAGVARGRNPHPGRSRGLMRLLALALLLPAMAALSVAPAQADGNSGTIKIHAQGSPSGTESNEPHVCAFDVEAFGFDEGFDGYIAFEVQGGDGPTGVAAGPFTVGPADATGYFASDYFNVAGGEVIQNGHYKVTLYGKFNGRINYEDVKAKSKVFKVDCPAPPPPPPPPTPVAPAAATATDVCEPATGPTDDRITIPVDARFSYTLDGSPVAAGPVVAAGTTHTVTAVPKPGIVVTQGATTTWTFTFTKVLCVTPPPPPPPPPVTPPVVPPVTPPLVPPVVPPVVTPPVVTPPEVLPEQAFGKAVGKVRVTCQGTVSARLANRSGDRAVYTLRVGTKVHRIAVRAQDKRKFVTHGPARAKVTLKVGSTRLDRVRIPARCSAPEVLPDTGVRATSS